MYKLIIMSLKINFGNKIRKLRKEHKMSQDVLCGMLGINVASLSAIETGKTFASYNTIIGLCEAFNILPKELFDFNTTTLNSDSEKIIHEIDTVLPELDNEKLQYIKKMARIFAKKD